MSEYQYYEFAAIDRPLTRREMDKLRAVSSRAAITPSSFVNHYEWGDLKADPTDWMRRYFDAFVYTANWCSCWLALRAPMTLFRKAELKPYISKYTLTIDASDEHWVFNWTLDESGNYDRFAEDDGSGWMCRLTPLREELLRGDLRPLYLGWLAGAAAMSDATLEPEVPPGLADLSPAQRALAEFLEVDPDLLAAACINSPDAPSAGIGEAQYLDTWLETWSNSDMKAVLRHIAMGKGREAERQVRSQYTVWLNARRPSHSSVNPRRTVAGLRELAESAAAERKKREARARKQREAERRQQRETHLRQMMAKAKAHWKTADTLARRGVASSYDQAVDILAELAEGYALTSSRAAFERDLQRFLAAHTKRRALLRRLAEAGLWSE